MLSISETIVQDQQGHPVWGSYAQRLLDPGEGLWKSPSNGGHDDKAHPPIHPIKFSAGEPSWSPEHRNLFELVVCHFLACVSQPAVGAETTVDIDIAGELFSSTGRVIIAKNCLEAYRFESWGGSIIPTYTVGQKNLQFLVIHVADLACYELRTLKLTGGRSSIHANHRLATSLYGKKITPEGTPHLQAIAAEHLMSTGGVVVPGAAGAEHVQTMVVFLCQPQGNLFLIEGVLSVKTQP